MNPRLIAQGSQPFAVDQELDIQQIIATPTLGADGFNIWWQKTFAQHTAMAAEASALIRAHRRVGSSIQARLANP